MGFTEQCIYKFLQLSAIAWALLPFALLGAVAVWIWGN